MPTTLVDSNVLLDVLTEDPRWSPWSTEALADRAERDVLVINPIIYAEVSVGFGRSLGGRIPGGEVLPCLSQAGWQTVLAVARLLHRGACQRVRHDAAHA